VPCHTHHKYSFIFLYPIAQHNSFHSDALSTLAYFADKDCLKKRDYLTPQEARSRWKSAVAIISSATGAEGDDGGHATKKVRRRLASSAS